MMLRKWPQRILFENNGRSSCNSARMNGIWQLPTSIIQIPQFSTIATWSIQATLLLHSYRRSLDAKCGWTFVKVNISRRFRSMSQPFIRANSDLPRMVMAMAMELLRSWAERTLFSRQSLKMPMKAFVKGDACLVSEKHWPPLFHPSLRSLLSPSLILLRHFICHVDVEYP